MKRNKYVSIKTTSANFDPSKLTREEHERIRHTPTRALASALVWDSYATLDKITIPREVMESPDLTAEAKLVYGLFNFFYPTYPQLALYQIQGLLGLSYPATRLAILQLEEFGLLKRVRQNRRLHDGGFYSLPTRYYIRRVKPRFENAPPSYMLNDIKSLHLNLDDYFKNIDFENELPKYKAPSSAK